MSVNFVQLHGVADLGAKGDINMVGESKIGITQVAKLQRHDRRTGGWADEGAKR